MRSALSVRAKAAAFCAIFAMWATIAFAQIPTENDEQTDIPAEIIEPSVPQPEPAQVIIPRAPSTKQRNTLCDTSYSRITNCGEEESEEQLPTR